MPISSGAKGNRRQQLAHRSSSQRRLNERSLVESSSLSSSLSLPAVDHLPGSSGNATTSAGGSSGSSSSNRRNPWAHVKSKIKSTSSRPSSRPTGKLFERNKPATSGQQMDKYRHIRHISQPSSHSSTSKATFEPGGRKSIQQVEEDFARTIEQDQTLERPDEGQPPSVGHLSSISGHLMLTSQHPNTQTKPEASEPSKKMNNNNNNNNSNRHETYKTNKSTSNNNTSSTYLISNQFFHQNHPLSAKTTNNSQLASSDISIKSPQSKSNSTAAASSSASSSSLFHSLSPSINNNNNSTTHLHHNDSHQLQHHLNKTKSQPSALNIRQRVNLKYVKTLIIALMALDLLITVFVHQFASSDELTLSLLWFVKSVKLRFSLLNLILSSIWFIILIGAIIFDIYFILLIACLVDILSFILLLIFSGIHFTQRIDYNTVQLTSLLALLFSIIVLHVYLLAMAALTTYLMLAVRQRKRNSRK